MKTSWLPVVVTFSGGALSLVACTCLLQKFGFSRKNSNQLFLRQLQLLALSDIFGVLGLAVLDLVKFQVVSCGEVLCKVYSFWFWTFRILSVLLESHIAMGVAFSWMRWSRGLRCLRFSLYWVLPGLAFACAAVSIFLLTPKGFSDTCKPRDAQKVTLCVLFGGFLISLLCYALAWHRAFFSSTGVVEVAVLYRSLVYACNFLLTYSLTIPVLWEPLQDNNTLITISDLMEHLNGFLNVVAYMLQSRYANMHAPQRGHYADGRRTLSPSFHVMFDPTAVTEISITDTLTSLSTMSTSTTDTVSSSSQSPSA